MPEQLVMDRPVALDGTHVPRVSVGMPVYNGEKYLAQALDSLLAQDFRDFELIISDNGSTDGTQRICLEYATGDPRIRYVRQEINQGAAWNFSEVVRLARGEYFRWACHDDAVDPTHLRRCVEALDAASPSVVLVYTRTLLLDEAGAITWTSDENLDTRGMSPHRRFQVLAQRLRYSNVLYGLIRREALMRTDLLGAYESADYVLLAQLSLLGEFEEIPAYLFHRRIHAGMSRRANRSARSVAQWFSPSKRTSSAYLPHVKLFQEYSRAVFAAPLTLRERGLTTLALWYWMRRGMRPLLKEMYAAVAPGSQA